jgi:hypothetical protein
VYQKPEAGVRCWIATAVVSVRLSGSRPLTTGGVASCPYHLLGGAFLVAAASLLGFLAEKRDAAN